MPRELPNPTGEWDGTIPATDDEQEMIMRSLRKQLSATAHERDQLMRDTAMLQKANGDMGQALHETLLAKSALVERVVRQATYLGRMWVAVGVLSLWAVLSICYLL